MNTMRERFVYSITSNFSSLNRNDFVEKGVKHIQIKVHDINSSEDEFGELYPVAFIDCRIYNPMRSMHEAIDLFDTDHGDTFVTAEAILKNKGVCFDDMDFIVYLDDIFVEDRVNCREVKAFLYANIKEIINEVMWIDPDIIMMAAENEDEEWISKARGMNENIEFAGIGKANNPKDQLRFYMEKA